MSMPAPSLPEMLATVRAFVSASLPGEEADEVIVLFRSGHRLRVPMSAGIGAAAAPPAGAQFTPNDYQCEILMALEGKALRTDALAERTSQNPRRLFKPGGLKELQDAGLVAHSSRLGYYRKDCPPDDAQA